MKYFLDGGTHFGQGLKSIIRKEKIDDNWKVYSWEANPHTYEYYSGNNHWPKITFYNQALSTSNGEIDLFVETVNEKRAKRKLLPTGQGSTTFSLDEFRENVHSGEFTEKIKVPCIDFVEWIEKNTTENDYIVIKLDIEGNEYSILEKLIKSKCMNQIAKMYIEWHGHFMADPKKFKLRQENIEKILLTNNIILETWR